MTVRVNDPQLGTILLTARRAVALEGPAGEPLGMYTPRPTVPIWDEMGISEEEYRRRIADTSPGLTTEQVLAHLRSL